MVDDPGPGSPGTACPPVDLPVDLPAGLAVDLSIGLPEGRPATGAERDWLPDEAFLTRFAASAVAACADVAHAAEHATGHATGNGQHRHELSVRLVDEVEGTSLNHRYRGVDRPTNVLSFPSGLPPLGGVALLGDLVFCPTVIEREAREQAKRLQEHWAHLVVHGTLHLLGHDHRDETEANAMEALEIRLLSAAGIADPYRGTADSPDE